MQVKGRIIKGISGFYYVCDEHSRIFVCKARGIFRKDQVKPLVGDFVNVEIVDNESNEGSIIEILPRKNQLLRPAVSNIDKVIIIFAIASPLPSFNLLDKLLIYYKKLGIPITVCFNKIDLTTKEDIEIIKDIYKDAEIELVFASFEENVGIDEIKDALKCCTTVLTGPSGVGKSTLVNALIPEANMDTGEISLKLKRGKHTTRHAELFNIEKSTYIFDTPGFTSFDIDDIQYYDIKNYYPEFGKCLDDCKFLDCIHIGENECGVKNALKCGKINSERYNNYKLIVDDIKNKNDRR